MHGGFECCDFSVEGGGYGIQYVNDGLQFPCLIPIHLVDGFGESIDSIFVLEKTVFNCFYDRAEVVRHGDSHRVIDHWGILLARGYDAGCSHHDNDGEQEGFNAVHNSSFL